ncbi:hypothetical protein DFH06DRAFT_148394 [Mycena polygramma]|nr:hypothetical protein DFH06DRAFT_148394 [Mycena polygramma]
MLALLVAMPFKLSQASRECLASPVTTGTDHLDCLLMRRPHSTTRPGSCSYTHAYGHLSISTVKCVPELASGFVPFFAPTSLAWGHRGFIVRTPIPPHGSSSPPGILFV